MPKRQLIITEELEDNVLSMCPWHGTHAISDYIREMYAMEISATEKSHQLEGESLIFFVLKQGNMEAIMIHPENAGQLKTVKSVLKALKVPFESQSLLDHVMASIDRGVEQAVQGKTIGLEAFKEKHFLKR